MKINKKGFTLIELLVVVLIIGILAAIALPQYFRAVEKSRSTEALSILGTLAGAMERARLVSDTNVYPSTVDSLDITFPTSGGGNATGSGWDTKNFTIAITGGGETAGLITATRKGTGGTNYVITKKLDTGKVTCGTDGTTGICASLGFKD
jgi:prepilin-type N-terminal cleavage/methylation domain-containing protein